MIGATLSGGECLTYPGFKELFLYLHSLGCEVSVFINGILLDQEWVDFFRQCFRNVYFPLKAICEVQRAETMNHDL